MEPKPNPTGTTLIRLADIPLKLRLEALTRASLEAVDEQEAMAMLDAVLEPGDISVRVAA